MHRPAGAQRPAGADTISVQAVAESLAVLDRLAEQIRHDGRNAALWFRQGMIAWALYDRDRAGTGVDRVDWTRIGRLADTSLRIAKALEPNNARYILGAGQYFLGTGLLTMRAQSYTMFGDALAIARGTNDALTHAEAALEVGRVYWRRYDAVANAGYSTSDAAEVRILAQTLAKDTANHSKSYDPERASKSHPYTRRTVVAARRSLDRTAKKPVTGFLGEADYLEAEHYMHEAYDAMPSYTRAYRQLGMLFADRARWTELEALARDHLEAAPGDAWSWLVLGLAVYRTGATEEARAAFDKGLALLNGGERARLDHLERVLRPSDTLTSADWTPAERAARSDRYWRDADPMWSLPEVDPRTEFLARIAYAELRWSVDELAKRGTDSDRGGVYVRYGPPDRIAAADAKLDWTYDYAHLQFRFTSAPTFGTAYFADYGRAHHVIDSLPATWDNTNLLQIDSIPTQVARFRAGDSVDVYFAGRPPVESIRRATDVAGAVRADFWLLDGARAIRMHDSSSVGQPGVRGSARRVAPTSFAFRTEASGEGSLAAGRASGDVILGDSAEGFPLHGFGVSDVVLASRVSAGTAAARWKDVDFTPFAGPLPHGGEVSLVWENYDLEQRDGTASYGVSVAILRERSRAGRIAAQLVGALAGAAKREASLDRVQMSVERSVSHRATLPDALTLSLGPTPPGTYLLSLTITDRVSGRAATRSVRIVIGDQ